MKVCGRAKYAEKRHFRALRARVMEKRYTELHFWLQKWIQFFYVHHMSNTLDNGYSRHFARGLQEKMYSATSNDAENTCYEGK